VFLIRFFLFCADAVNDFLGRNCPYIAGAISFYTLFAIFPLFLAIITILSYILGSDTGDGQIGLAKSIATVLPVSGDYVSQTIEGVVRARAISGVFGVLGLLWASMAVFGAIRKGINAAWGIRRTRPFFRERLIDFALVIGAGVLLLAVLFSGPALKILREVTLLLAPESQLFNNFIWDLVAALISPVLTFVTFLILYRFLPYTDVRLRDVWPGAVLASLAFSGSNLALVWYVKTYPLHYNVVYGGIGAILALLTWVYLSAIIVLFGALITSRYAGYASSIQRNDQRLKLLATEVWRVRLRVVGSTKEA
jgi:membrane protein